MQLTVGDLLPLAQKQISAAEAASAIYLDFEGRITEPPVLLGVTYAMRGRLDPDKTVLMHYLLDPAFEPLKSTCNFTTMFRYETRTETFAQTLHEVIRLARSRDRLIVSWNQYEMQKVLEHGIDDTLGGEFALRYRDGEATAKQWQRAHHADVQFEPARSGQLHTLANYMTLIDHQIPDPKYGVDRTGMTLKFIREALGRRSSWDHMTERRQSGWVEVLGHNAHECLGLRAVVTRAATELESADDVSDARPL